MRSALFRDWRAAALLIIVAAAIGTGARFGSTKRPLASPAAPGSMAGSREGDRAPDFALPTLEGRTAQLRDFRGKVVLLNFWATWCAPCRIEMPWLVEFNRQYHDQGLQIVGVNLDDPLTSREKIAGFAHDRGVTYPILLGNNDMADAYGGARFLPQTFFIGPDGRVLHAMYGVTTREAFEAEIRNALSHSRK